MAGLLNKINYQYVFEKFVRDAIFFFVGTEAVTSVANGDPGVSLGALGAALLGACGTAAYRVARDLFFSESA